MMDLYEKDANMNDVGSRVQGEDCAWIICGK